MFDNARFNCQPTHSMLFHPFESYRDLVPGTSSTADTYSVRIMLGVRGHNNRLTLILWRGAKITKRNLSMNGPMSLEQHIWQESEINHCKDEDNHGTIETITVKRKRHSKISLLDHF